MSESVGVRGAPRTRSRLAGMIVALPSKLTLASFWVLLVVWLAILVGHFSPAFVLVGAALVIALTWRLMPLQSDEGARGVAGSAAALLIGAGWAVLNAPFVSEVVLIQRDAGFLTLQGIWLSRSEQAAIPLRTAGGVAAGVPGVFATSDAFWQVGDVMVAQGAKAFPGLLGIAGWGWGVDGVLTANLVVGALALIAVYDFARRLIGPVWGLVPMAGLAVCMPFLYFTRTPFTEPVNVLLLFTGLSMVWSALRDPRWWRFALAGAVVGACTLSRIDGAMVSIGLVLGLGLAAGAAGDPRRRVRYRTGLVVAAFATTVMVVMGYLDLRVNSPGYLADLSSEYRKLIVGLVIATVLALTTSFVLPASGIRDALDRNRVRVGTAAALAAAVVALVMVTRPLWLEVHRTPPGTSYFGLVEGIQAAAGVPVDGTRSYDEMTVSWIAWHLGWPTVFLAAAGLVWMTFVAVARRRLELVVLIVATGVPTLLYLWRPSITPDQVWAMRRLLPVALPAALVFATWTLSEMAAHRRVRPVALGLTVVVLLIPALGWRPLLTTVEQGGRLAEARAVCGAVGPSSHVVVVRTAGATLLPTIRILCDLDVVELREPATPEKLAAIRDAWPGVEPLVVVTTSPESVPWEGQPVAISTEDVSRWPEALLPPTSPRKVPSAVFVGRVADDGSVTPLTPTTRCAGCL